MGFRLPKLLPERAPPKSATEPVPKGSMNTIATTWTAPAGIKSDQAIKDVKQAFESYPQEGQNGIDKGGWKVATADGTMDSGTFRVEYTSSSSSWLTFLLNGGQGFVDDVLVDVQTDKSPIETIVRSSSRMGKSDLGVNKKRLQFLGQQMREKQWEVPEPQYP